MKIIVFCCFWPKWWANLFKCGISCYFGLQFPRRYFYNHDFLLLNVFLMQNTKKSIDNPCFFFFTTLDLIWPKFCPEDHTHFTFFGWFPMNMLGDSINMNNLCCNGKKLVKPLKFFLDQFAQKRSHYGPRPKWKTISLAEIAKADHQLSETYFIKILCFDWVMSLFLSWVMFFVKKV